LLIPEAENPLLLLACIAVFAAESEPRKIAIQGAATFALGERLFVTCIAACCCIELFPPKQLVNKAQRRRFKQGFLPEMIFL